LRLNEALSEARRLSHAQTLAVVLASANWMESITRSPEMYRHAEELLALSSEHQFPLYLGWATGFRGWSLTALGQAEEGLTLITRGLATIRGTGSVVGTLLLVIACAETYVQLGRLVEASNCLAEAAHMIETTEERFCEAELHRLRGELNATSDQAAAEQSYRRAIVVSERQDAKALELRAATSLARLWRDQGKVQQALELLAPVYGWFTEGFDTRDPREARALLGALAS
jgi:predicted ATPase